LIKIILDNGFYYKGEILRETKETLTIKDITGKTVEIKKTTISVREED